MICARLPFRQVGETDAEPQKLIEHNPTRERHRLCSLSLNEGLDGAGNLEMVPDVILLVRSLQHGVCDPEPGRQVVNIGIHD